MKQSDHVMQALYEDDLNYEYHQDYRDDSINFPKLIGTVVPVIILTLALVYQALYSLDFDLLPLPELFWNALVWMTPTRLINAIDEDWPPSGSGEKIMFVRTHAEKSQVMRRCLGFDSNGGVMGTVASAKRRLSTLPGINMAAHSDDARPPGLGNWDNSCYQNSVLQGLSSLRSLAGYLAGPAEGKVEDEGSEKSPMKMAQSLRELIADLNDFSKNGKRIWTPAALKSMSSWQQQDAQEYFSKVLDEVDKEVARAVGTHQVSKGFTTTRKDIGSAQTSEKYETLSEDPSSTDIIRNPLEGLLAQRVGCTRCGYAEGLSMIPFNCLTVPIGREWYYDISECLDEYTKLEPIEGVECGKCTLLKNKHLLSTLIERSVSLDAHDASSEAMKKRLEAVNEALEDDDYEDKTLLQKCKISSKNRVTTTKSRQAVIARPPKSLAMHVNRSLFDEMTGELKKNYAEVRFPKNLDLGPWCLGSSKSETNLETEEWLLDPVRSMIASSQQHARIRGPIYTLRAVVTHYGRHENGHYICYRKHPVPEALREKTKEAEKANISQWWRLSDDDVSKVSEKDVLGQGGVFMLFYDLVEPATVVRSQTSQVASTATAAQVIEPAIVAGVPLPREEEEKQELLSESAGISDMSPPELDIATSTSGTDDGTEGEVDQDYKPTEAIYIPTYMQSQGFNKANGEDDGGMRTTNMVMV